MRDQIAEMLANRIIRTHNYIASVITKLAEEEICLRPASTAPPIGWHVWHISRWADWFQASFPHREQLWETQNWLDKLSIPADRLGPMQTGMTMEHDAAANVPELLGKTNLIEYMEDVFRANEEVLNNLDLEDLYTQRESFAKWRYVDGQVIRAKGQDVLVIDDIGYHFAHANRHLGMIEALIGASLQQSGTVSI